jgi:hypothetical protein
VARDRFRRPDVALDPFTVVSAALRLDSSRCGYDGPPGLEIREGLWNKYI